MLDVLNGQAVDEHAAAVASEAGSIDATFLAINRGDVQGTPLIEMAAVSGVQMDPEEVVKMISGMSVLRRAPRLQQFADTVAFLASDRAAGITATKINVTSGVVPR